MLKKILFIFKIFLFLLLTCYIGMFVRDYFEHKVLNTFKSYPHNQNAWDQIKQHANDPNGDFTFAIIGDINGEIENFEKVIENLSEMNGIDFLILLGDCAAKPTYIHHHYFIEEFNEHNINRFPTFITAGNHDVAERKKYPYKLDVFEKQYGPADFAFLYKNTLFVILGKAVLLDYNQKYQQETIDFVNQTFAKYKGQYSRSFVFTHISPILPKNNAFQIIRPELVELFNKYKVDYIISGHEHRYARMQLNNSNYVIAGTGGAKHRDQDDQFFYKSGKIHCFITYNIHDNNINELFTRVSAENIIIRWLAPIEFINVTYVIPNTLIYAPIFCIIWIILLINLLLSFLTLKRKS